MTVIAEGLSSSRDIVGFVVHTNPAKVAEEVGQFWWSDSRIDASVSVAAASLKSRFDVVASVKNV